MAQARPSLIETTDAPASSATAYALPIGQSAQGTISTFGDRDWYAVSLLAGNRYSVAAIGTGTNSLRDSFLRLRDAGGAVVASDDDSGPQNSSLLQFTPVTSGTYYIEVSAYNDAGTGQYGLSVTAGSRADFDYIMGAGALDANASWSVRGAAASVTYGFRQSAASYTVSGHAISTFTQLTAAEMAAVQTALQFWSEAANISFNQVNPTGYTDSATVLVGNYSDPSDGAGAFAFYPGSTASTSSAGDLWLNLANGISTSSDPLGSYSALAIEHELGHAIGLSHPGDYNAAPGSTITYNNSAQFLQDFRQFSVMSYFSGSNTGEIIAGNTYPFTPLMFDIYAVQNIYGANARTRSDNTIYGFNSNAGSAYAFSAGTAQSYCIWDGGGTDTLDCSGYGQAQTIDIEDGSFPNIVGGSYNISIALNAMIENARGGSGNDTLIGNALDNELTGGLGDDSLYGGLGRDTAVYSIPRQQATITRNADASYTVVSPEGRDLLTNLEAVRFSDTTVQLGGRLNRNDYNGDQTSDIMWQHTSGPIFQWNLSGTLMASYRVIGTLDSNWKLIGTGDFDGNGRADLLWQHGTGAVFDWLMNGSAVSGGGFVGTMDSSWRALAVGDFNGDGRADVVWEKSTGQVQVWLFGDNAAITSTTLGTVDSSWRFIGAGDFNGDGMTDLLWQQSNGTLTEWQLNGTSVTRTGVIGLLDSNWKALGLADFNGDGKTDILWQHSQGLLFEWLMNDLDASAGGVIGRLDGNWKYLTTGDFNADGRADILWQHVNGIAYEWQMNGTATSGAGAIGLLDSDWKPLVT